MYDQEVTYNLGSSLGSIRKGTCLLAYSGKPFKDLVTSQSIVTSTLVWHESVLYVPTIIQDDTISVLTSPYVGYEAWTHPSRRQPGRLVSLLLAVFETGSQCWRHN